MSNIPKDYKYTNTHEWIRQDSENTYTVGITDHAQTLLGDLVYVELPNLETEVEAEGEIAVVESVKAASDVYSPLNGKIIAINESLENAPDLVNTDPYADGWLFQIEIDGNEDTQLMTAQEYEDCIDE